MTAASAASDQASVRRVDGVSFGGAWGLTFTACSDLHSRALTKQTSDEVRGPARLRCRDSTQRAR